MMNKKIFDGKADKKLAAVCGLFCPACHVFIGTQEDQGRLKVMARRLQRSFEKCSVTVAGQ